MNFAARSRLARRQAGLSQAALAVRIGVGRSAVSNWEIGAGTMPTVENIAAFAVAAGVAFEWIASGRGPMRIGHDPMMDIPAVDADFVDDPRERRLLRAFRCVSIRTQCNLLEIAEESAVARTGRQPGVSPHPR